jgi:hypothetical protein
MSTVYTLLQCIPAATTAGLQFHKHLHTRDNYCGVANSRLMHKRRTPAEPIMRRALSTGKFESSTEAAG